MSIDFWVVLWKVCLIGSLIAFAAMSVLVIVGGAWDIRRLFQRLREQECEEEKEPAEGKGVE